MMPSYTRKHHSNYIRALILNPCQDPTGNPGRIAASKDRHAKMEKKAVRSQCRTSLTQTSTPSSEPRHHSDDQELWITAVLARTGSHGKWGGFGGKLASRIKGGLIFPRPSLDWLHRRVQGRPIAVILAGFVFAREGFNGQQL